jgi:predicted phosphodiesterase
MNIQIVSDIHIEFWGKKNKYNFIKPSAPILALLGDICCCSTNEDFELFKGFINELLPQFEHIILIPGNHEYYFNAIKMTDKPTIENTIEMINKKLRQFCNKTKKLHFLNNNSINLKIENQNYQIIGTTLWSNIPKDMYNIIIGLMNDYSNIFVLDKITERIRKLCAADVVKLHNQSVKYIKSQSIKAKKNNVKLIVLTHHKPYTCENYDPKTTYCSYETDLKYLLKEPIIFWAYGHTHSHDNRIINNTRLYSNPKGYPGQKKVGYINNDIIII